MADLGTSGRPQRRARRDPTRRDILSPKIRGLPSHLCILDLLEAHRGEVEVDIAPRSVCSEAVIEFDKH